METLLSMSIFSFSVINWPLCVCNTIANFFFAFCIICPASNISRPKQPVKILLESLVCCNTVYLFFLTAFQFVESEQLLHVALGILNYTVSTSMSTSVWLAFFHFTQIVPVKTSFFIWVKKNIKLFIYAALVFDRLFFLFVLTVTLILNFSISGTTHKNATKSYVIVDDNWSTYIDSRDTMIYVYIMCMSLELIYTFFCLCVMMGSGFTTVCYLQRHIRNMSAAGSLFSSPRVASQMRVTITGILQGVLYFICQVYIFISFFADVFSNVTIDVYVSCTVISLYVTGTTLNLGVGQTLFRQRAVFVCSKMRNIMRM